MKNLLLEIGCEEIPARFMPGLISDLKSKAEEKLKRDRLTFDKIETLGTCRRLVLYVENLAARQADLEQEVKGPPADIAFDKSGKATAAAEGFARQQGITAGQLIVKPAGPKNYVFARIQQKGQPTEKILSALLPEIILSLYLPLSMRWGELEFKFIRPIHSLLALYGNKVVKFELAGIKSGNTTFAHRYRNVGTTLVVVRGKGQALSLHSYKDFLLKLGVMVDHNERKALTYNMVKEAAESAGGQALLSEELLNEVNFLVEYPAAYAGEFKPEFLQVPQEVLITSMKKNQKYFPMVEKGIEPAAESRGSIEGNRDFQSRGAPRLLPKFVVVTDNCKNRGVVEGNQKVLSARLSDARFFFDEDKKEPFKLKTAELESVAFFEKLGNMYHKCERMAKLAEWVGKRIGLNETEIKITRRIAELSKADLSTRMVYEFPELQGVMGREYARLSGEDPRVAQGIYEHYLPRFAEDNLPESREGICVALADRLDSIIGAFAVGAVPTGSEDPYGIRRAVNGVIRIVLTRKIDLLLDEILEHAYKLYEPVFLGYLFNKGETGYQDFPRIKSEIISFIAGRVRAQLIESGIRYDAADAALFAFNDILDAREKAAALSGLTKEKWFPGVVLSADRLSRIAGGSKRAQVIEHDFIESEEKSLHEIYLKINWEVGERVRAGNFREAAEQLAVLTEPIEHFFDKILVMHQDERIRANRLALLKSLELLYLSVADFRKMVLS